MKTKYLPQISSLTKLVGLSTFFVAALLSLSGITKAQQPNPPGSYLQSCTSVKVNGGALTATCPQKEKGLNLGFGGGQFQGPSTINNFFECYSDIANDDGKLTCSRNASSPKMQQTRKSINEAAMAVLGQTPTEQQIYGYITRMFSAGYQSAFYSQGGFLTKNVTEFLRSDVEKYPYMRDIIVKKAFMDVYNWAPGAEDNTKWVAAIASNKIGYAEVVAGERAKMNNAPAVRKYMINTAYMQAFGRPANASDFSYWQPRTEIYKELIAAQRNWLHSSAGAKDLTETVVRAWEKNHGSPPKDFSAFGKEVQKAQQGKLIFSEM